MKLGASALSCQKDNWVGCQDDMEYHETIHPAAWKLFKCFCCEHNSIHWKEKICADHETDVI